MLIVAGILIKFAFFFPYNFQSSPWNWLKLSIKLLSSCCGDRFPWQLGFTGAMELSALRMMFWEQQTELSQQLSEGCRAWFWRRAERPQISGFFLLCVKFARWADVIHRQRRNDDKSRRQKRLQAGKVPGESEETKASDNSCNRVVITFVQIRLRNMHGFFWKEKCFIDSLGFLAWLLSQGL